MSQKKVYTLKIVTAHPLNQKYASHTHNFCYSCPQTNQTSFEVVWPSGEDNWTKNQKVWVQIPVQARTF